jgi:hypothetical protein
MALPPKHGSWLDLAESELGVLATQCHESRLGGATAPKIHAKADWHFTTENARIKLKHLYPSL